ncbi:MAG TPA: hypothetical protein VGD45_00885 [Steroidobacter sp.]|uniref:hypothetical protein n=1 Tax=Steroidobacter sp. TaxID=1978227 RepID=UPI002ED88B93
MNIVKSCWIAASATVLGTSLAFAISPHFLRASDSIDFDTGEFTCSWKEVGLGNNALITYVCSASATATFVCINHGGRNPSAANKTTVEADVGATGTFPSTKNGSITASLTVEPPGPGEFSCPPGQSMGLAQVSYTNVLLTDTTNGIAVALADQSTGCLLPNVVEAC